MSLKLPGLSGSFTRRYLVVSLFLTVLVTLCLIWYTENHFNCNGKQKELSPHLEEMEDEYNEITEGIFRHQDIEYDYMNTCALPVFDVWHPSVKKFVTYKPYDPNEGCNKDLKLMTQLTDGKWEIIEKGGNCSARCWEMDEYKSAKHGEWMKPGSVDCEFLEAVCWNGTKEVYGYIHSQIIRKPELKPPKEEKPNVFVFLLDSMSFGMAKRSLSKTLQYFSRDLDAVEFPYVNKVGENTHNNLFPMWFGKQVQGGKRPGGQDVKVDWNINDYCERNLDNDTHIFKEFSDQGYVTMYGEDWMNVAIDSWPFCEGFKYSPVHHPTRPYQIVFEKMGTDITQEHMDLPSCRNKMEPVMEHFEKFIEAYKDMPMFGWAWLNHPAHSDFNQLGSYDTYFDDFFNRHSEILKKSFVFLMSDHGFRMGVESFLKSPIGNLEKNNPYLAISIPQQFMGNSEHSNMYLTLKRNSKSLQTHYDTRATMLDILKYQPISNFTDRKFMSIPGEKGQSYLRKQSDDPRTCGTLPIPEQYCICQVKMVNVEDPSLRSFFGNLLIDHVNRNLAGVADLCITYKMGHVTSLTHFGVVSPKKKQHTYKISVKAHKKAHFETLITHTEGVNGAKNTTEFGHVIRLDAYGDTVECTLLRGLNKLCYCKSFATDSPN